MKKIKYYDRIKKEIIEVEVTDEVAEAMRKTRNNELKQNRAINKNEFSVDNCKSGQALLIDQSDNPLEALIKKEEKIEKQKERRRLIKEGMKTLTEKERELIDKIFYKKRTQAQVAKELNIARSTISKRYKNAMNKLELFIFDNERY